MRGTLAAMCLLGTVSVATAQPAPLVSLTGPRVYLANQVARAAVERAVHGAAERLARNTCQVVLDDFPDATRPSLRASLEATGASLSEYLFSRIWFVDGGFDAQCRAAGTAAFTAPGYKVVHICPAGFVARSLRETATAEALIIHELLHTLGLGENPPSSAEITRRVMRRCGG